jgi:nucleoside-diphosphate-sugar epimerase
MGQSQKCLFGLSPRDLDEIVRDARTDLLALKNQRLFLTGGTGFFGTWLLAALARADDELGLALEVTALSRDPAGFLEKFPEAGRFNFIPGDVIDFSPGSGRFDFVLHAATDTVIAPEREEERSRVIIEGTRRVAALGGRLLNISSGGVYGPATGKREGASEEDEPAPVTAYGRAKLEAEKIGGVVARAFAFLGPWLPMDAHYAAGNFLRDARAGGAIVVRGDGTALRSYLYPTDLATWLLALLVRGREGRAYNVGSDEVVSTGELARRIAGACTPAPTVTIQSAQPHGPQNIYLPDIARARGELGLEVRVKLDEAIRRTLGNLQT